jgi:dinuclear metal center YbgI/SA1388 family protein
MCSPDTGSEVFRVLVTLDVTEDIVDYAISSHFDLVVSHHPLIFKPIKAINDDNHVARKIIKLLEGGVSVFSFHTRADKVVGGVNDSLCDLLGMYNTVAFGEGMLGRIGDLDDSLDLEDFAYRIKTVLGADSIRISDAYNPVSRVAIVGGDGKDFVKAAIEAGADTYVSGRIGYNVMAEAPEMGLNMIEAGHYFTEQPVTEFFRDLLLEIDSELYVEVASSNVIKVL